MSASQSQSSVTLVNLRIWDGQQARSEDALQIEGSRIRQIAHSSELKESEAPARTRIDCTGLTAIPGLIDAHVHLELNPDEKDPPERTEPSVLPLMAERAAQMARQGITTARDLGGGAWHELALRDAIAAGEQPGPRLLCSGQPITSPGGHCHFWGGEAADLAAAHTVLQRQVDHGVDLIKIMATGGRMTRGSEPTDAQFSLDVLKAVVTTAHQHQLPVAAHCHGTEGIHRAALAGVDTIEHCSWVGREGWASDYQEDVAQVILDNGVWVSPTVNRGWQRMLDSKTGAVLKRVRTAYQRMLEIGIPLVASTDAGIPGVYHADLPHALVVFARIALLSPSAALKSATSDAARALRIDHITGTLAAGKDADILVLDGDPLDDLQAVTRPVQVYCRGRRAR
ncbi:MAG: amidohydrolase family protein [Pseudomonadota bacterium]